MRTKLLLLLIICAFTTHHTFGYKQGQSRIDSLLAELPAAAEDTNKGNLLCAIAREYSTIDPQKAIQYAEESARLCEKLQWKSGLASAYTTLGSSYWIVSDLPSALNHYLRAMAMYEKMGNKRGVAVLQGNIALVYHEKKDLVKALEYYLKALKGHEALNNQVEVARNAGNIGTLYFDWNDDKKALEYYLKALGVNEKFAIKREVAINLINIAGVYVRQKEYQKALEYGFKVLDLSDELGDTELKAAGLSAIGEAYLTIAEQNAPVITHGGDLIPKSRKAVLAKSVYYLNQSIPVFLSMDPRTALQAYEYLSKAYELSGNYKEGSAAFKQYVAIKDSIFSKDNTEKITRLEVQSEYEKKALADSLKFNEAKKISTLKLQRQKGFTYAGIAGVLLLSAFSFFIFKERKKSEALLLNILPSEVALELKRNGTTEARHFDHVTVLFTDFVNFTSASERMSTQDLVDELHTCFKAFDSIIQKYRIEKIKTIGDAYLAVSGLPRPDHLHAFNVVNAAIEIRDFMNQRERQLGDKTFKVRIGVHSGSVVAGIVGVKKFAYDIWGDTVNTAARMEQNSTPGMINISESTYELVKDSFLCQYRGELDAKNKGLLKMYFLEKSGVAELAG